MKILPIILGAAPWMLVLSGCPRTPPPVPPAPDADASSEAPSCATWCRHAVDLGCAAAKPTPGGASCADVCTNTLDGPIALDVRCRTAASSCAAADQCEDGNVASPSSTSRIDAGSDASLGLAARPPTCAGWCARAADLRCPAAKPTPGGSSCVDVCSNVQTGAAKWDLRCRANARSCAAADRCEH